LNWITKIFKDKSNERLDEFENKLNEISNRLDELSINLQKTTKGLKGIHDVLHQLIQINSKL
jgi:archaellum component FlaC